MSVRLAVAIAFGGASLAACNGHSPAGPRTLASIAVTPNVSLAITDTQRFIAVGKDADGAVVAISPVWSVVAGGGVINNTGLFTAATVPGTFANTVQATSGRLSGTATVTVTTGPLAAITVSPTPVTLSISGTQQLTAVGKDAGDNVVALAPTWAVVAGGGSIAAVASVSGSGVVTGVAAGSATVTATSEGVSGTAAVTVAAGTGGGTLLLQENFADSAFAARGWYDNPAMPVTTAEHMPGATSALEIHLAPGAVYAPFGTSARHAFQPTPTLYVSYWVKYSTNWVGSGTMDHPHEFYVLSDLDGQYAPLANDWLTSYIETNFVNGVGTPRLSLQDNRAINATYGPLPMNLIGVTENRSVSGCNGVMETNLFSECYGSGTYNDKQFNRGGTAAFQNQPGGAGYKSHWNHVEVYLQMNSIVSGVAVPDGVAQYWFNGTLIIDRHDVVFRAGARTSFNFAQFVIGPYIGIGSRVDQYMWVDNLTLTTGDPRPAASR
jgi:hypothetical protein